jgi:hypothetical protein
MTQTHLNTYTHIYTCNYMYIWTHICVWIYMCIYIIQSTQHYRFYKWGNWGIEKPIIVPSLDSNGLSSQPVHYPPPLTLYQLSPTSLYMLPKDGRNYLKSQRLLTNHCTINSFHFGIAFSLLKIFLYCSHIPTAHTCNPSFIEGWDWEDCGVRPVQAKS